MAKKLKLGNDLINAVKEIILETSYPVGRVIVSIDNVNPGTYLGGTWISFGEGRTLVGVDANQTEFNTVEKTGGEKVHTLTGNESGMPKHRHLESHVAGPRGGGGSQYDWNTMLTNGANNTNAWNNYSAYEGPYNASSAHNNLQPYITTYFWKRTA